MAILIFFFFYNLAKKENWIYKLSFRFFYLSSIPRIPHPCSLHFHPYSLHSHTDSPHSQSYTPHSYPHFVHSHPDSPHSNPYSLHSRPHSLHSPHSVHRFPIPAFTDSPFTLAILKKDRNFFSQFYLIFKYFL